MTLPNQPVRAVAFDLDGLMFNTEEMYTDVATRMLQRRGHQLDMRLIRQMMGRPANMALPIMIQWYGLSDDVATLERETKAIFDELLPVDLAPMPGLLALIDHIDKLNLPKAITTSSRLLYVQRILELAQLPTEFDFLLTAEDVHHGKPHPEIYQLAAERFGIEPTAMLVLEDSEHGCQAAAAAGALTVAVPGPHNAQAQFGSVNLQADTLGDPRILAHLPRPS